MSDGRQTSARRVRRYVNRPEEGAFKPPETLMLALLLFPGLLSERVAAYFVDAPTVTDLQLVASALAATLVNLALALAVMALMRRRVAAMDLRSLRFQDIIAKPAFVVLLASVSVGTGLAWAWLDSHDTIYEWVKASERVSRRDLLTKSLQHPTAKGRWTRVVTEHAVYHGHIRYVSSSGGGGLFLERALQELADERSPARVRHALESCKTSVCRVPVICAHVGKDREGAVFLPMEKIELIEFRSHLDQKTDISAGTSRTLDVYSCDFLVTQPPPATPLLPPEPAKP